MEQAVVATDPQARILYWNFDAERLYGWRTLEITARRREGRRWSGEFPVRRRDDDTEIPVLITDSPAVTMTASGSSASSSC